jgi:hypothetical protein
MATKPPSVKLIHHDFHEPIYTSAEQANFKLEVERIQKNISILEDQLAIERAKLAGLQHLLK